jgi:hypothetical protein
MDRRSGSRTSLMEIYIAYKLYSMRGVFVSECRRVGLYYGAREA